MIKERILNLCFLIIKKVYPNKNNRTAELIHLFAEEYEYQPKNRGWKCWE